MSYEFFLARRYAFTRRRENFITVISIISMLGITVGTAALITVLSVFNGFSSVVTDLFVSFDPHVRITLRSDDSSQKTSASFAGVTDAIKKRPEVAYFAPVVRSKVVLVHYTLPRVGVLTGIDPAKAREVSGLAKSIQSGSLDLSDNSVVVGQLLADQLALVLGDTIQVFSPMGLENILTEPVQPRTRSLIVRGIFAANNREYDAVNAYTSLASARDLFDVPPTEATSIDIKLHDIQDAEKIKTSLQSSVDTNQYSVATWYDLHKDLYSVMEIERWIAYVILFLIVAVASFNIFSSLTLTVFEKQRDIGLLRTLGSNEKSVRNIYLLQGTLVGVVGTVVGCLLGLCIVVLQQQTGFFKLDISVYIIPALPVQLRATDFVLVAAGSLLLSTIGAWIPAKRAAKVRPAEAMRWE
jgi:lipoprotein-releasing system permease protein